MKEDITIISCGTLREDLEKLVAEGLLEGVRVVFTDRCLKERPRELERQLKEKIDKAKGKPGKILVIYGDKCFIDTGNPERDIDAMIEETGAACDRLGGHSCIEMMLSEEEKEKLAQGQKVYWLMPAWIENRNDVFFEWDVGKRNQTFPQHDTGLVVDSRGYFANLLEEAPEKLLDFSDWMGLPLDGRDIDLDRFKGLVLECVRKMRNDSEGV